MATPPKPPIEEIGGGWGAAGDGSRPADPGELPEDRRRPPTARLVRIGAPDRGPFVLAAAAVLFLAIAVVKPWPGSGGTQGPVPAATPVPTAQPTVDPLAAIRLDCQDPPGWRIFSRERWAHRELRSWRTLDPAHAAFGPLDPAIPDLPIGPGIVALGYCAIWSGPDQPPDDAVVHAWSVAPTGGRATPIVLDSASRTLHPPLGALFGPPAVATPPDGSTPPGSPAAPGSPAPADLWPPGTFVFEVEAGTFQRWWAITIFDDPRPPQPTPIA